MTGLQIQSQYADEERMSFHPNTNERLYATRRILVKNKKSHSQNSNTELRMGKSLDSILY